MNEKLLYLNVKTTENQTLTNYIPNTLNASSVNSHTDNEAPAAPKLVHLSLYIEVCGANLLLFHFSLFCCKCILLPSKKTPLS